MNSEEVFKLTDICKNYGGINALSSISFNIKQGETVALIGPSGAGKTTLLNILGNIVEPSKGKLIIDGLPASEYRDNREFSYKVGVIRQQFDLIMPLQVIHNVLAGRLAYWGTLKSIISLIVPRDKELALDALRRVGLIDKAYEKTSSLSGGEQQRVALARLLVQGPKIILADEPVASLDPTRSRDILNILTNLVKEQNQTLITSIHSVEYAKEYFDRIISLKDGRIYFDLPSKSISQHDLDNLYKIEQSINV